MKARGEWPKTQFFDRRFVKGTGSRVQLQEQTLELVTESLVNFVSIVTRRGSKC